MLKIVNVDGTSVRKRAQLVIAQPYQRVAAELLFFATGLWIIMHRVFQTFIDHLSSASDSEGLQRAMVDAAAAFDLPCFAYLTMPNRMGAPPRLISNYPLAWTTHYLRNRYERLDPVIVQAVARPEPFDWGLGGWKDAIIQAAARTFEEAARFGFNADLRFPSMTATV